MEGDPDWTALKAAHKAAKRAQASLDSALAVYRSVADPIYAANGTVDGGVKWLVGGWAAS